MRLKHLVLASSFLLLGACAEDEVATVQPKTVQPGTQADLVANVGDRIFFDFDKAVIRADAKVQVGKWVEWLKKYPNVSFMLEGNCDERGTREYNIALGHRRANAAKGELVKGGVDVKRLSTTSFGKEKPAVMGSNEAAWAQNRRVEAKVK